MNTPLMLKYVKQLRVLQWTCTFLLISYHGNYHYALLSHLVSYSFIVNCMSIYSTVGKWACVPFCSLDWVKVREKSGKCWLYHSEPSPRLDILERSVHDILCAIHVQTIACTSTVPGTVRQTLPLHNICVFSQSSQLVRNICFSPLTYLHFPVNVVRMANRLDHTCT